MNESNSIVKPHVEIYTDGGCEPNPGRLVWRGVVASQEARGNQRRVSEDDQQSHGNFCRHRSNLSGQKVTPAIWKTSDATSFPCRPCVSPIFRWMTVTKTNLKPMACAQTCRKASHVTNVPRRLSSNHRAKSRRAIIITNFISGAPNARRPTPWHRPNGMWRNHRRCFDADNCAISTISSPPPKHFNRSCKQAGSG